MRPRAPAACSAFLYVDVFTLRGVLGKLEAKTGHGIGIDDAEQDGPTDI